MEPRNEKSSRFQIQKLEERIAPKTVSHSLGDGVHASGEINLETGGGPASGTITGTPADGVFRSKTL